MNEIELIKKQIDKTLKKFEKEYAELGNLIENKKLPENELKIKAQKLDEKSGLNKLFEKLANLIENKNN